MFKRYKPFLRAGFLNTLAYKFNIFSWLLANFSALFCLYFIWVAVFQNSTSGRINGFNMREMIAYCIVITIFSFTIGGGDTQDVITDEIQNGQIAMSLIKPISYRLRFVFTTLGNLMAIDLLVGVPTFVAANIFLIVGKYIVIHSIGGFIIQIILFFISQVFAVLLMDVINYIVGIISFYTLASFGLFQIKEVVIRFLSGALIPIAFFPGWAEKIVSHLPFVGIAQNPTLIFLGKMDLVEMGKAIGFQIVWIIILEMFAYWFFQRAIKKVTIQGG